MESSTTAQNIILKQLNDLLKKNERNLELIDDLEAETAVNKLVIDCLRSALEAMPGTKE